MKVDEALSQLSRFPHGVLVTIDPQGYPLAVATRFQVQDRTLTLTPVKVGVEPLHDTENAQIVFSHIRPLPGYGYDERAAQIRAGMLELARSEGFWEHYNPLTARGQGGTQFTWTAALTLDLLAANESAT